MSQESPKPPRHAALFELIRQSSMAQYVNHRISNLPVTDPCELEHLAHIAERSLGISTGAQAASV